ncbi:MAG TPA: GntR family transcriptional regulator [Actinomycetota bacterium]|nr:GntR family transcriptional regulator [Actinomycetota bacterium]
MRLRIDPLGPLPASTQLREALAVRITSGRLAPGTRLPPVRELAAELGLAPNTVAKAYRELGAAGYLEARGRHGTFVADELPEPPDDVERALDAAADVFAARARHLGVTRSRAVAAARRALTRRPTRGSRGAR